MLLLAGGHLLVTVVESFIARAGAVLACLLTVSVRPTVLLGLVSSFNSAPSHCKQASRRRPERAQQVSTIHGQSPDAERTCASFLADRNSHSPSKMGKTRA
jgi:hypothetical protein